MKIGGIYYDSGQEDRYVILKVEDNMVYVKWLGDDGLPENGEFGKELVAGDEYLGQATELMMVLL